MIRTLAGVAAGIAVAIVLIMVTEALGNALFPPPSVDLNNPNSPSALPFVNQLFPILGWFVASLVGGWLAIQVSARDGTAWLVAASVLVGEALDFSLGRHAVWVMVVGVLAPLVAAWLAQKLPRWRMRTTA
jgi:hypothetical protein